MKKLKTGASRNSSSDVRRSLLLDLPNTNSAFTPRASQQNFAVAISAENDHFEAAMILEHKGYSIEAFATPTMTWSEAKQEKYRLLGPYESLQSRNDAEAWEPLPSC